MKVNEFNFTPVIEEGIGDAIGSFASGLLGGKSGDAIKKLLPSGGGGNLGKLTQDIFVKDFYNDAMTSLNAAIKSGWVDPKLRASQRPVAKNPATVAGNFTGTGTAAQKQTLQNINDYVKAASASINAEPNRDNKLKLVKELVNFMADRHGTPEWNNALGTVKQIIKKSGTDTSNTIAANLQSGKTMTESWRVYAINKLLESVDMTWNDLGIMLLAEGKTLYIAESKFAKLDMIFESIMEAEHSEPISAFISDWFNQYMTGVNWSSRQQMVNQYIDNVEKTYNTDGSKEAMMQLGLLAFALSKAGSSTPMGAKNAQPAPATTGTSAQDLIAKAEELKKKSPAEYQKAIQALSKK